MNCPSWTTLRWTRSANDSKRTRPSGGGHSHWPCSSRLPGIFHRLTWVGYEHKNLEDLLWMNVDLIRRVDRMVELDQRARRVGLKLTFLGRTLW
jgi:hypothetical protein